MTDTKISSGITVTEQPIIRLSGQIISGWCSRVIRILAAATISFSSASAFAVQADNDAAEPPDPQQTAQPSQDGPVPESASEAAESGESETVTEQEPDPRDELPISQRPYLVRIEVGLSASSARLNRASLAQDISAALRRMYGDMWTTDCVISSWLVPGTSAQVNSLTTKNFLQKNAEGVIESERYPTRDTEKVFLLSIEELPVGFRIGCREYDTRIQELTPLLTEDIYDSRLVAITAARLMRESFRPCLFLVSQFTDDDGMEFVELQTQAGEYPPPSPAAEQVREEDVLRPFMRHMERRDATKLRQLQTLDLTYIRIVSVDREIARGRVRGVLVSHTPMVPFGRKSRRAEQIAVRQRPAEDSSRVRLVLKTREDRPLVSYRVNLAYKLRVSDQDAAEQTEMITDRDGYIRVPVTDGFPTFWLYVYSGSILLARVPYSPGLLPEDTVRLPDDSVRLGVEGDLQILRDELVDAVAIREVYFSLARKAADGGEVSQMEEWLEKYADVPGRQKFLEQIGLIEAPALKKVSRNRTQQLFIERMCRSMRDSVTLFFSDEARADRLKDIEKMRTEAEGRAAAQQAADQ